jgi:hypothetical protein
MNKDRYVVRDTNTGDYVYRGWDDGDAARALIAGRVFGVGNTFTEAEAEATYRMCRQRQQGENYD